MGGEAGGRTIVVDSCGDLNDRHQVCLKRSTPFSGALATYNNHDDDDYFYIAFIQIISYNAVNNEIKKKAGR